MIEKKILSAKIEKERWEGGRESKVNGERKIKKENMLL